MSDRTVPAFRTRGGNGRGVIESMIRETAKLDPDIWHIMDKRDNTLIEEELQYGAGSVKYVYDFRIGGTRVTGISVIGARELASAYGGIQHSLIGSISKVGKLFVMKSYPHAGQNMGLFVQQIPELMDEPDYYEVVAEVRDIKTGNTVQIERREYRFEQRSAETLANNPSLDRWFERPHYQTIAGSKAFRNGVLSIIPQHKQLEWKEQQLALSKSDIITGSVIDEKRSGVLRYAAAKAIGVDRQAIEALTFDQIAGLSDAAREGSIEQFLQSAEALGIVVGGEGEDRAPRKIVTVGAPIQPGAKQASNGATQGQGKAEEQAKPASGKKAQAKQEGPPAGHPAAGDGQPPAEEKKAAAVKEKTVEEKKPEPPGFDHYALDEITGEPIIGTDGQPLRFNKPGAFSLWYNDRCLTTENKEALREVNADALDEAMHDPAARVIIEAVHNPEGQAHKPAQETHKPAAKPEPDNKVALETLPNGRPNWPKYVIDVTAALAKLKTEDERGFWIMTNEPVYTASKSVTEVKIHPLLEATRQRLAKPVEDPDLRRAQGVVKDLDTVKWQHEYDAILGNPAIRSLCKRFSEERTDLRDMIKAADNAAQERIKPKAQRDADEPPPGWMPGPEDRQMQGPEDDGPSDEESLH